jgi:hypothetical protein
MGECKQDACTTLWGLSESEVLVGLWGVCKPGAYSSLERTEGGEGILIWCCLVGGLFFDAGCKQDACTTLGGNLDGCCVVGWIVL